MATVNISGSSNWVTELTYDTNFNERTGKSSITVSSFRIKKGTNTTSPSTAYDSSITFNIAGSSFSSATGSYTVPAGGNWSSSYGISGTASNLTPNSSQTVAVTSSPWSNQNGSSSVTTANYKTYTISYNANGGSGAPGNQTKTWGTNLTLSSTIPTKSGYTFLGWATSSSATTAQYAAGGTYTANADVLLYAVWEEDGSFVNMIWAKSGSNWVTPVVKIKVNNTWVPCIKVEIINDD